MANYRIPGPLDASRGNHNVRDGTGQRMAGVTPGFISGSTPGNSSAWDTLVKTAARVEAVSDAIQVGRDRAGAAILKETGHALEELVKGLIPGLLMMMVTLVATTVIGGAIGAAIGFFFGGVGAAPGAVIGADIGMSAGMTILTWLGLGFLAVGIAQGFGELIGAVSHATTRAWAAPDSPRTRAEVEAAGDEYAYAIALLFKLILMAIVARLTMGQAKASTQETLALLRKSKLGEGFAAWVAKNQEALLSNPRLRPKPKAKLSEKPAEPATTPSQAAKAQPKRSTETVKKEPEGVSAKASTAEAMAAREKLAKDFYAQQGYKEHQIPGHLNGIDFTKPVDVVTLPKGTVVEQWQVPGGPQGSYYALPKTSPSELGISPQGTIRATGEVVDKVATRFVTTEDVQVLRSSAKSILDTWSVPGQSVQTVGGATQFMTSKVTAFIPGG